jgi:hypothetical protein
VVESAEFKGLIGRLKGPPLTAWKRVEHIATGSSGHGSDPDSMLLLLVRNNLAFHYGAKVLARGYASYFADRAQRFHEHAVVSDGENMEQTRFYFADAAIEQALCAATKIATLDELQKRRSSIAEDVDFALKFLVMAHIREVAKLAPYTPLS